MSLSLVLILVFCGSIGMLVAASEVLRRRSRSVQRRLGRITAGGAVASTGTPAGLRWPGRTRRPVATDYLPFVTRTLENRNLFERVKLEVAQAGLRLRPSEYVGVIGISTLLFPALGLVLTRNPLILTALALGGFCLPQAIVKLLQAQRKLRFASQLPDALILVASSIRSGYSFLRAIQVVADQMPAPISEEFARIIKETNLGGSLEASFRNVLKRVPSYDLDLVITAVLIQMQVGGNLADIMDTIAETIRERVKLQREIAALTAEGRLSGIVCFLMPVFLAVVMTLLNPEYMSPLYNTPIGLAMLLGAFILQVIGGLIIKKMLAVDV
jgi:tight adherence protein B